MNITKNDLSNALRDTLQSETPEPLAVGARSAYIKKVMKKILQRVGMCPDDQNWWVENTSGSIRRRVNKIKRKICEK